MKIYINEDELFSIYDLDTEDNGYSDCFDVDEETFARWKKAIEDFLLVQFEMGKLYMGEPCPS